MKAPRFVVLMVTVMLVFAGEAVLGAGRPFVMYSWDVDNTPTSQANNEYLSSEARAKFGVELEFVNVLFGEIQSKFPVAIAGGTPIDIVQVPYQYAAAWAKAGLLLPLNDLLRNDASLKTSNFIPGSFDPVTIDGQVYAVPTTSDFSVLILNVDMWDEVGLDAKVADNWDWNTFLEAAQKLTVMDANGQIIRAGYGAPANTGTWWGWLFANGGKFFNSTETAAAFNTVSGRESLEFLNQLLTHYRVMETGLAGRNHFQDNKVAILDNTPYGEHVVLSGRPNMRVRFANYPKGPHGQHPATDVWHNYHAVAATTRDPVLAREVLAWYLSLPVREATARIFGSARSPYLPFYRSRAWADMVANYPQRKIWPDLLQQGMLQPTTALSLWQAGVNNAIGQAIRGELAVPAALEEAERIVNAALQEN